MSDAAEAFAGRWRPGPLLPDEDDHDLGLIFAIAVLCFFACATALLALASDRASRGWSAELQGSVTVLVRPKGDETADAAGDRATETLAGVRGVAQAVGLERAKSEALLKPWLGAEALPDDVPIPHLITVELAKVRPASADDLDRALKAKGIDATVDDHSLWLKDIKTAAGWARTAAGGAFGLIAAAAAAVIAFATRAGLAMRREAVEVLHLSGAEDGFIARLFLARFARMGAVAGLLGAGATAVIAAAARLAGGGGGLTPVLPVAWSDIAWLAACPVVAAGVAAIAAWASALRLLKAMT